MFKQFRKIEKGEFFVVAGDGADGCGNNNVCQFLSCKKMDVPIVYRNPELMTQMTNDIYPVLEDLCDRTGFKPLVAYERAKGGVTELDRLEKLNRNHKWDIYHVKEYGKGGEEVETDKLGWSTNGATRPIMLTNLKEALDYQLLRIYDEETLAECTSFVKVKTSTSVKAKAEYGAQDDCVMALAIANQLRIEAVPAEHQLIITNKYNRRDNNIEVEGTRYFKRRR